MNETSVGRPRRPEVGVGVLVVRDDSVLLGLRRGSHGAGTWSPPGGHLELGEDPIDCVRREAFEEAGIELGSFKFVGVTNDVFEAQDGHYVTLSYTSVAGRALEIRAGCRLARAGEQCAVDAFRTSLVPRSGARSA